MAVLGITAVGGGIGQAVLHALRFTTPRVKTIGMDARAMSPGLYWADTAYLIPVFANENAYVRRLLEIVDREAVDLLIPGLDPELPILACHRERFLHQGCEIVVGSPEAIRLCRDKHACHEFCRQRGLPFIKTYLLAEAQAQSNELSFPVIVKPRDGSASAGAQLCRDAEELRAMPVDERTIVQSYLPPDDRASNLDYGSQPRYLDQSNEISCQYFVGPSGKVLGRFASVNRLKNGVPIEIVPDPDSPALDAGAPIVEGLVEKGLQGPINLQGRLTRDGVLFFETNARFTGITATRATFGYREVEAAIWAFCAKDEQQASKRLQYHPGNVAMRYVASMMVPQSSVQAVARTANEDPVSFKPAPRIPGCVLVTGASGYIGAALVARLLAVPEINEVRVAVRDQLRGNELSRSLTDCSRLRIVLGELPVSPWSVEGAEVIIHAAAIRHADDPLAFFRINSEGVGRLLEATRLAGVRLFVYLSSQSVYGLQNKPPWTENMPARPETPYALSKRLGESVCLSGEWDIPEVTVLRIARTYGLGRFMRWSELPHKFSLLASQERPLPILENGENKVDLLHIRDLTEAVLKACVLPLSGTRRTIINVGGGDPVSVSHLSHLCQTIAAESGLHVPASEHFPSSHGNKHNKRDIGMDIALAKSTLDWTPSIVLKEGLFELFRNAPKNLS